MLSHNCPIDLTIRPKRLAERDNSAGLRGWRAECLRGFCRRRRAASRSAAGHGPLRVEHHVAAGRQGASFGPGVLSARCSGATVSMGCTAIRLSTRRRSMPVAMRCWRRSTRLIGRFPALFAGAGRVAGGFLRPQRDVEDRRRGSSDVDGRVEGPCGHRRLRRVRRTGSQVPDVGTGALPRPSRQGHGDGARVDHGGSDPIGPDSDRRERGNDDGPRLRESGRRWRTGPSHSRARPSRSSNYLSPKPDGVYVDGTFGAGGYTRAVLAVPGTRVVGIDRDQSAVAGSFSLVDAARPGA